MKDEKKTRTQLIEEVAVLRQRIGELETDKSGEDVEESLKIDLAMPRLRNEVLQMQGEEDWGGVTVCIYRELRARSVEGRIHAHLLSHLRADDRRGDGVAVPER